MEGRVDRHDAETKQIALLVEAGKSHLGFTLAIVRSKPVLVIVVAIAGAVAGPNLLSMLVPWLK